MTEKENDKEPEIYEKDEKEEKVEKSVMMDLSKAHISREEITELIGIKPKNLVLYRTALLHKSIDRIIQQCITDGIPVQDYMKDSFERLEYLGDSLLNFVVANYLFDKFPDKDEGFLTRLRTRIVRSSTCANFAKEINLGPYILTSNKILGLQPVVTNEKILEDCFEALIGAIYKDYGDTKYVEFFIKNLITKYINLDELCQNDDNYKDIMMRYTQVNNYNLPIYELVKTDGPSYNKTFTISLTLKHSTTGAVRKNIGIGVASTKKAAEQIACKNAICMEENCICNKIHYKDLESIINRVSNKN